MKNIKDLVKNHVLRNHFITVRLHVVLNIEKVFTNTKKLPSYRRVSNINNHFEEQLRHMELCKKFVCMMVECNSYNINYNDMYDNLFHKVFKKF